MVSVEKPEDFYRSYAAFKQYRTPAIKAKQQRWYDREFWIPARCTNEMSVLELGSGPGEFLLYLQRKGVGRFLGVEMDRDAVAAMPAGLERYVHVGDIWDYLDQSGEERWDRIVMLDVLEHFSIAEGCRLLARLGSILTSGGMVVARVPNMGSPWGGIHQFGDITHKAAYAANGLVQLGLAAGFQVEAFVDQKRGSPVRRILEGMLYWTLTRILVTQPVVWSPNIIVVWRKSDRPA